MESKILAVTLLSFCLIFSTIPVKADIAGILPSGELILHVDSIHNKLEVLIDDQVYKRFPIALGKPDTPSPVGEWKVIKKATNWGSGFGTRWIGLNVPWGIYGIHGTNKPGSIGQDLSSGCIRMYNRDVEQLYEWVQIGTKVTIIGHPMREPKLNPRRLASGDVGIDVQLVQSRLKSAGFFKGVCDGRFDTKTEEAVRAFEKVHHWQVDGVIGPNEYRKLGLVE